MARRYWRSGILLTLIAVFASCGQQRVPSPPTMQELACVAHSAASPQDARLETMLGNALDHARSNGGGKQLGSLLVASADLHFRRGEYARASDAAQEALTKPLSPTERAAALLVIANIRLRNRDFVASRDALEKVLELTRNRNRVVFADALLLMSNVDLWDNDLAMAEDWLSKACEVLPSEHASKWHLLMRKHIRAAIAIEHGDYAEARSIGAAAVRNFRQDAENAPRIYAGIVAMYIYALEQEGREPERLAQARNELYRAKRLRRKAGLHVVRAVLEDCAAK